MPIYDYTCSACGHLTEVIHGINDHGPRFCPECGAEGTMTKAFTTPAIHFKGSGWAKKERRSSVTSTSAGDKDGSDAKTSDSSASKPSDSKEPAAAASTSSADASGSSSTSKD